MWTKLTAIGMIGSLAAGSALAADGPSREEHVGVGAGVVIGAVAGGPVGAIIGAALGAKLGDSFNQRNEQVDTLNGDLRRFRDRASELEKDVDTLVRRNEALDGDLRELQALARPELLSLLQAGIEMDLLFRTDEHVLNESTGKRLKAMAATLASMSDVHVKLDGFADERGDATYNQTLSKLRAEYVRDLLVKSGIPEQRIEVTAKGESPAADHSVDSYALERRVSLTLFVEASPSFAATPAN